jgi:hypothetical protein
MCSPRLVLTAATLAAISSAASAQTCLFTEPPTPSCAAPRVIPGNEGQHVVLMDVTTATGTPTLCGSATGRAVWFSVTPQQSGPIKVSTCNPGTTYDTLLEVYRGGDANCNGMVLIDCGDDSPHPACDNGCSFRGSEVTFNAIAGMRYRFVVGAYGNNSAGCNLCLGVVVTIGLPCGDAPVNLDCNLAREISGDPGVHEAIADVTDAFTLPSEPQPACSTPRIGHSVWYRFTAAIDGMATFTTCHPNTNYDTVVQAYTGDCNGLALVDCNDDDPAGACINSCSPSPLGSTVMFPVAAGGDYWLQVGSYGNNSGNCPGPLCLGATLTIGDDCGFDQTPPVAQLDQPLHFSCGCAMIDIAGKASDPDGTFDEYRLEYHYPNGPPGWTLISSSQTPIVNGPLGSWNTLGLQQGYYLLRLTAINACDMASTDVKLVWIDGFFDVVIVRSPVSNDVLGGDACIDGTVIDHICFEHYTVDQRPFGGGQFVPVDPSNPVYLQGVQNDPLATWDTTALPDGLYELRVSGLTRCGNGAQVTLPVIVDNTPPTAVISTPLNCENLDGIVQIVGTAQDANLAGWSLQYSGGNSNGWTTINSGATPVINGVLANWDTRPLPVCNYALRLVVTDTTARNCLPIGHQSVYITSLEVGETACDINGDGVVDAFDIEPFINCLISP